MTRNNIIANTSNAALNAARHAAFGPANLLEELADSPSGYLSFLDSNADALEAATILEALGIVDIRVGTCLDSLIIVTKRT